MDAEKLSELFQGMEYSDDEDETLPEAFLCPITHVSTCVWGGGCEALSLNVAAVQSHQPHAV